MRPVRKSGGLGLLGLNPGRSGAPSAPLPLDAMAVQSGRLLGDRSRSLVRLCLAQMQRFGLVVASRGIAASLVARLRGMLACLRRTLVRVRG